MISEEHRRKLSESHKGKVPWNKGLTKENSEIIKKESLKRIGKGNPMYGKKLSLEHRLKISNSNSGKNSHLWQGGITPINNNLRHGIEHRLWRESVFKRDNYICRKCGIKGKYLNPHHIFNFWLYKNLRFIESNGITLCKDCHNLFHSLYGKKYNNIIQIAEFIQSKLIFQ